ncbi:MAG: DUF5666 domain-containing protein [Abditibacteriales bacterium]|nr:DUF5666 domain-containing protein [Abditibacteriales bacterium]MDW8367550.1 DUF5666 domain-containing protein [Abditibacteriales bacterium]
MKKWALTFTLSFVILAAGLCYAGAAKGAKRAGAQGKISAIDTAQKTLTLVGRQGVTTTVSYTDTTKVFKAEPIKIGDLKTGDVVIVQGAISGSSIDARAVIVRPSTNAKLPKKAPKKPPTNRIIGSVTSTAPLKVKTVDTEYEVKTTDATHIVTLKEGSAADMRVGDIVAVQGQAGADGVVRAQAIEVVNLPRLKGAKANKPKKLNK